LAFANILQGVKKEELSIDLMRYLPEAPHGVMDYLFIELMLMGKEGGYRGLIWGWHPFLDGRSCLGSIMEPDRCIYFSSWENTFIISRDCVSTREIQARLAAKYLASPGGLALPRVLINIASLISGGVKGVVSK